MHKRALQLILLASFRVLKGRLRGAIECVPDAPAARTPAHACDLNGFSVTVFSRCPAGKRGRGSVDSGSTGGDRGNGFQGGGKLDGVRRPDRWLQALHCIESVFSATP
jgi:hypothetical protein